MKTGTPLMYYNVESYERQMNPDVVRKNWRKEPAA